MDYNSLTIFGVIKKRLDWLTQRQEVLAQNIANSNTPGYVPKDLSKFKFHELLRRERMQLNVNVENPNHLEGERKRLRDWDSEKTSRPYETQPDGNSVILEEQMGKINETTVAHNLTTQLYKKQLNLFKIALDSGH